MEHEKVETTRDGIPLNGRSTVPLGTDFNPYEPPIGYNPDRRFGREIAPEWLAMYGLALRKLIPHVLNAAIRTCSEVPETMFDEDVRPDCCGPTKTGIEREMEGPRRKKRRITASKTFGETVRTNIPHGCDKKVISQ